MAASRWKSTLRLVALALVRRKARLAGAVSALAVGSALLAALLAVTIEIPLQMGREFRSYGANLIITPSAGVSELTDGELASVTAAFPASDLIGVAPEHYETLWINRQNLPAIGVDFDQTKNVFPYWQVAGDWPRARSEVLLGAEVAEALGLSVGQAVLVTRPHEKQGLRVTVSGIVRTGQSEEESLFVDRGLLAELYAISPKLHLARISLVADQVSLEAWATRLSAGPLPVIAQVVRQLSRSEDHVLGMIRNLLVLVTIVISVLTFVCVATTMMASVLERRTEIGLKKALGARNRTIAAEFLAECAVLGTVGGVLGMILGYILAWSIGWSVFSRLLLPGLSSLVTAFGLSLLVAVLAGLSPLRSATALEPANVLRGE